MLEGQCSIFGASSSAAIVISTGASLTAPVCHKKKVFIMTNMINMGFNVQRPADFLALAQQVVTSMTGNANFPEPWPAPVASLAQITSDLNALQAAVTATAAGDKTRLVERKTATSTLAKELSRLARYVELQADDDALKLSSSGFALRIVRTRSTVFDELPAPAKLSLAHGALSGQLNVRASPLEGAGSYQVQLCTTDPTVEANWTEAGVYKNCTRIQLNSLTPGKTYSVRMRGIGNAGPGSWTPAVSLMSM
jgi:hypothetical protein